MTQVRKTIKVETLKAKVNAMLEKSDNDRVEGRQALAVLLETILMDTGNYHGYTGPQGSDDSRRRYF